MNSSESHSESAGSYHPPAGGPATTQDLRSQYESLQNLFHLALVGLIIFGLGVSLFIFKQMRLLRMQLEEQRPNVSRLIADYQKNSEPLIRNFSGALERFAATNRDFQPIMEKYRPLLRDYLTALPGAVPAAAPVPMPAQATNR